MTTEELCAMFGIPPELLQKRDPRGESYAIAMVRIDAARVAAEEYTRWLLRTRGKHTDDLQEI